MTPWAIQPGVGRPIGTKGHLTAALPALSARDIPRFAKYRAAIRDIPRLPAGPRRAGELRARLALIGRPIGPYDLLIAGQAQARHLTLVTHNTAEFGRIDGLTVEDWEAP